MPADIPEGFAPAPLDNPFSELIGPVLYRSSDDGVHI
jgi:hypothetical protein